MGRLLATPGNRNISYHGQHAQVVNGVGWGAGIISSHFHELEPSHVRQFELFQEFGLFWGVLDKIRNFRLA